MILALQQQINLVKKIVINKDYINKNLDNLVKDTDLSKFILYYFFFLDINKKLRFLHLHFPLLLFEKLNSLIHRYFLYILEQSI